MTHRPTTQRRHRILVVANETAASDTLHSVVRSLVADVTDARVLVVAPALNTRLRRWLSDDDAAREVAVWRLQLAVERLTEREVVVDGMIGDADPLQAIDDALAAFPADEVVVSTHPESRSNWLARNLVRRTEQRHGLPVTHVVVVDSRTGRDLVVYASAPTLVAA